MTFPVIIAVLSLLGAAEIATMIALTAAEMRRLGSAYPGSALSSRSTAR